MENLISVSTLGDFKVATFETPSLMGATDLDAIGLTLDALAGQQANGKLILDFSRVEAFASQAIGIIVSLHKKVTGVAGGQLVLCGVSPQLMQLLKITRLDRLLKVVKTRDDALK